VSTPIGNLSDITLRALEVLGRADAVFAEDTRHTRRLLGHHGLAPPLVSAHAHNEKRREAELVRRLGRGEQVALVTDAGTPGVADPGARLVSAAARAGFPVIAIPGPSALASALAVSGVPADAFTFAGFLPAKEAARRRRLGELLERPEAVVFYEAPHRARRTLELLVEIAPRRELAACRELTKVHEEVLRGTAAEILRRLTEERERGEWTIVVSAPPRNERVSASERGSGARSDFERGLVEQGIEDDEARRRADFIYGRGSAGRGSAGRGNAGGSASPASRRRKA